MPAVWLLLSQVTAAQTTINVPANQPTIQAAINAASNGDTVLVAPGTYNENINFNGKAITVTSSAGAAQTIIDGGGIGPVVTFNTNETISSTLNGFTLQHGISTANSLYTGAGVFVYFSAPTITNNIIQNNNGCNGGGIGVYYGSPLIRANTIASNTMNGCSGGSGAISVGGSGSTQIIGNVISNNSAVFGNCGGISLDGSSNTTIQNNTITGNVVSGLSPASVGGAICMWNILSFQSPGNSIITQNVIYGNTAGQGGGIYAYIPSGARPLFANNTIVGSSTSPLGSAVYITGYDDQAQFVDNLLIGASGTNSVYCDNSYDQVPPVFANNDEFSPTGTGLGGSCSNSAGLNGNISADPLFVNAAAGNFHLQPTSPAIDAGTNSAPNLPQTDFAGTPRILDGNNDCVSTVDMGAYELALKANTSLSPTSLAFPPQILNTTSAAKAVMLSNTGATCFQFSGVGTTGDYAQNNACPAGVRGGSSCTFNVTFDPTALGKRVGALNISGFDGTTNSNLSASMAGIGVDFSVAVSPTSVSVHHSQPIKVKVSVTPLGGKFANPIALSCSGMPAFSSCTFSPATVTPGELVATSTLTIAVGERAALGSFNILINGTSGSDVHSANLLMTIF